MRMLHSIGGVILGLVVAYVIIMALETAGHWIFPLPPGTDIRNPESIKAAAARMPAAAFALVLVGWAAGTFAGAWVAARVAGRAHVAHGLVLGALLLALGVANMLMIPHPAWMWVLGVAMFIPCAFLGARLAAPGIR